MPKRSHIVNLKNHAVRYAVELGMKIIPTMLAVERDGHLRKVPLVRWRNVEIPKEALDEVMGKANAISVDLEASRLLVLDVDDHSPICNFWRWLEEHGHEIPETLTARTGSGGRHYYFEMPEGLELAQRIPGVRKVDIKHRGIAVLPPSRVGNMEYTWVDLSTEIAEAPQWLLDAVGRTPDPEAHNLALDMALQDRMPRHHLPIVEKLLDIPNEDVDYETWLQIGMGLHFEYHGSEYFDHARELFLGWTSRRAEADDPEAERVRAATIWDAFTIDEHKTPVTFGTARKFITELDEAWKEDFAAATEVHYDPEADAVVLPGLAAMAAADGVYGGFPVEPLPELNDIPPIPWVLGHDLMLGAVTLVASPGGAGKSALMVSWMLSIMSGKPIAGDKVYGARRVAYWAGEDAHGHHLERRLRAACLEHDLPLDLAHQMGVVLDRKSAPLRPVIPHDDRRSGDEAAWVTNDRLLAKLKAWVHAAEVEVVIIDPISRIAGLNENDVAYMSKLAEFFEDLSEECNVSVVLCHHVGKGTLKANDAREAADAVRGSSALVAAVRVVKVLRPADSFWEPYFGHGETASDYTVLADAKANHAATGRRGRLFRKISIPLDNGTDLYPAGDHAIALAAVELTDVAVAKMELSAIEVARALQAEHDRDDLPLPQKRIRTDGRSGHWVGYLIAEVKNWDIGQFTNNKAERTEEEISRRAGVSGVIRDAIDRGLIVEDSTIARDMKGSIRPGFIVTEKAKRMLRGKGA